MRIILAIAIVLALLAGSAGLMGAQEKLKAEQRREVDPKVLANFTSALLNAIEIIETDHVRVVPRSDLLRWTIEGLYQSVHEQIPASIAERLRKPPDSKDDLAKLVSDARKHLGNRVELRDAKDFELALEGVFQHLEPGTGKHIEPFIGYIDVDYVPRGIGLQLQKNSPTDPLRVVTPLKNGSAYRAKILAGDEIVKFSFVEDGKVITLSCKEMSLADIVKKLKGKAGSTVKLTIRREGVAGTLTTEVAREKVEPERVFAFRRKEDDSGDFLIDRYARIAYIRLANIVKDSNHELVHALRACDKEKMNGLILDLRFNPGELIQGGVDIASQFIDKGIVMRIEARSEKKPIVYEAKKPGAWQNVPLVCLVNEQTSQIAEVMAACLQDHGRAVVVGEQTAGDTSRGTVCRLSCGGSQFHMYLTTAFLIRPSGKNLSKLMAADGAKTWGVIPDEGLVVPTTAAERASLLAHLHRQEIIPRHDRHDRAMAEVAPGFKDRQLEKALECLRQRMK